jgi:hypothetical protein
MTDMVQQGRNYTTGSGTDYCKYDVTMSGVGVVFSFTVQCHFNNNYLEVSS